jgi:hypothetical protein
MILGMAAVAGLSWREAWRGRLWLVPLGAAALIGVLAPSVDAADPGGAVRLLAAASSAAAGFCGILIAALVPAAQLTRDIENRIALTAFPKPLPRIGWLLGRWGGAVLLAGAAGLVVAGAGSLAVAWRAGGMPQMRQAQQPETFQRVTGLGETVAAPQGATRLTGPAGDGVRWHFTGLDTAHGPGYEVLVQARVSAAGGGIVESAPIRVTALLPDGGQLPLALDPASPYGRQPPDAAMPGANCWLADRGPDRTSLASDWARLHLPRDAIAADGSLSLQLSRLDPATTLQVTKAGCAIAVPAGLQPMHAARAVIAELAAPAVVAAAALAVAAVATLPVALLAALTLAFAGHALWAVQETLTWGEAGRAMARLLELLLKALPDLSATGQGVRLAASEAVTWSHVGQAWLGIAPHLIVLLALGWWALSRRQL